MSARRANGGARGECTASADEPSVDLSTRLALRPHEAADALGISERALRTLLPELPVVRCGAAVLLPVRALLEWLERKAVVEGLQTEQIVREAMIKLK
jgi:hypothetical protein